MLAGKDKLKFLLIFFFSSPLGKGLGKGEWRHGKMGGLGLSLGRVNRVCGSFLNGLIGLRVRSDLPVFFKQVFFFFNYKKKSMTTCLERINKIN